MTIINTIVIIDLIVWLIIPLRQYKTKLFLYFLILGLLDPIQYAIGQIFQSNIMAIYLFGSVAMLYGVLFNTKVKIKIWLMIFFAVLVLITMYYSGSSLIILQIIIHSIIFISFLRILVVYYSSNRKLLLFHLVLVVYEFSLLLKFFVYMNEVGVGPIYYYVTTAFQILIGIFFLFVNELNSPKLSV